MPIIQFILPSRNKALKKLLHTYWEVCPKYDENGKLKQEMILVVNAIRNDLVRFQSLEGIPMSSPKIDTLASRITQTNTFEARHYDPFRNSRMQSSSSL